MDVISEPCVILKTCRRAPACTWLVCLLALALETLASTCGRTTDPGAVQQPGDKQSQCHPFGLQSRDVVPHRWQREDSQGKGLCCGAPSSGEFLGEDGSAFRFLLRFRTCECVAASGGGVLTWNLLTWKASSS